jgi:hypothetical protein
MNDATKVVIMTVGISALLSVGIIAQHLLT